MRFMLNNMIKYKSMPFIFFTVSHSEIYGVRSEDILAEFEGEML